MLLFCNQLFAAIHRLLTDFLSIEIFQRDKSMLKYTFPTHFCVLYCIFSRVF